MAAGRSDASSLNRFPQSLIARRARLIEGRLPDSLVSNLGDGSGGVEIGGQATANPVC